ncbi:NADPH:quinone oxidoreductase family protein [Lichenicoccus sp.]|uniref:NADPH:quinone oxidoreductase family protein n=1 Tax=Lichenicoccus sp. TaxID=2781899 RepID=UPI003D09EB52
MSRVAGGPETLELTDLPAPSLGAGQLLVRILACGINYPDVLIIEDKYQTKPPRPFIPGGEVSGVVEAVGDGVSGWQVGDRLMAVTGIGGLAERIVVAANVAFPLAADRDPNAAAGLLLTYATTIHALVDRGQVKAGETLLVLGAAGGVGLAAIEIGKALGARVVAAVSTAGKAEAATAAGADSTLVYSPGPFDKDATKALAGQFKDAVGKSGADVVYDPVGGDYCEPALRSLGWGGRYLVVGFPAGIPRLPLNLTLLKSCDVRGVFWGAFAARNPQANQAHVEQLMQWWREGKVNPKVGGTWPLEQGGDAIAWLASRQAIGKAVVTVSV